MAFGVVAQGLACLSEREAAQGEKLRSEFQFKLKLKLHNVTTLILYFLIYIIYIYIFPLYFTDHGVWSKNALWTF